MKQAFVSYASEDKAIVTALADSFELISDWEWVEDCWSPDYNKVPDDGTAWTGDGSSECKNRIIRGGSREQGSKTTRSADRHHASADADMDTLPDS